MVQSVDLPLQPGRLIGRAREVEEITRLLLRDDVRLVTLVGPAGVGKTRLAIETAGEVAAAFEDGAHFVDLAPITDAGLVLTQIAKVLGVREVGPQPLAQRLLQSLREQHVLLLLDNFEQVIEAAEAVAGLLESCPALTMLVTSRERLRVRWEQVFTVPPLSLPRKGERRDPDLVLRAPAAELFVERARAAAGKFDVTAETAPLVADVCERLNGLPLAIELAAGRMALLPLPDLARRLERRLDILTNGARDLPGRHQTLRAAIDWSYQLLVPEEQALFRRLGIFVGGFSLSAAEAVAPQEAWDVLDRLASLVQKSLVQRAVEDVGEPRFTMLEMVREFAHEQLAEAGELEDAEQRRAEYLVAFTEQAEREYWGPLQLEWLERVEREFANIWVALHWCADAAEGELGQRISSALWRYYDVKGQHQEARDHIQRLLEHPSSPTVRARALRTMGYVAVVQGDRAAIAVLEESVRLCRELRNDRELAWSLAVLAVGQVVMLKSFDEGAVAIKESLSLHGESGEYAFLAGAMLIRAEVARFSGDAAYAKGLLKECVSRGKDAGDTWSIAYPIYSLGILAMTEGNLERSENLFLECLRLRLEARDWAGIAHSLDGLAFVAVAGSRIERAALILGASAMIRARLGLGDVELAGELRPPIIAQAKAQDAVSFERGWKRGRQMRGREVLEYVFASAQEPPTGPPFEPTIANLTRREIDVLRVLAAGKSDVEIAKKLVISIHTVHGHVRSILGKTGTDNRTQAAIFARDSGLVEKSPARQVD